MKKIICIIALLSYLAIAIAQNVSYGINAGLNISSIDLEEIDYSNISASDGLFDGWNIGGTIECELPIKGFYLDVSLMLNRLRFKANRKTNNPDFNDYSEFDRFFISVPLLLEYQFKIPHFLNLFTETGPDIVFTARKREMNNGGFRLKPLILSWNVVGGIRINKHWKIGYRRDMWLTYGVDNFNEKNQYVNNRKKKSTDNLFVSFYF